MSGYNYEDLRRIANDHKMAFGVPATKNIMHLAGHGSLHDLGTDFEKCQLVCAIMQNALKANAGTPSVRQPAPPPAPETVCFAKQYGDTMRCTECGVVWDPNDARVPKCGGVSLMRPRDRKFNVEVITGRRIVQLTMSPAGADEPDIAAVCNDGSAWLLGAAGAWHRLPAIPQDEPVDTPSPVEIMSDLCEFCGLRVPAPCKTISSATCINMPQPQGDKTK